MIYYFISEKCYVYNIIWIHSSRNYDRMKSMIISKRRVSSCLRYKKFAKLFD